MRETEVKILEINPKKIRNLVMTNSGKKVKKVLQKNVFYKNSYTEKKDIAARIRKEDNKVWITIKSPIKNQKGYKVRREYEMKVKSFEFAEGMLSLLGLKKIGVGECKREYFKMNKCMIEIVKMPKIPTFLEIEGTKQNIIKSAKILGYSEKDYATENVLNIYKIKTKFLKFKSYRKK